MIELFINDNRVDLNNYAGIGITYSVGSILQLNTRSGYVSNNFTIPKTSNNNQIFGFVNKISSFSEFPYSLNRAKLYDDGVLIINDGNVIIQGVTDDSYSIIVSSGNVEFFDILEDVTISDLDLSDLDHTLSTTNFLALRTNTSGYKYPIIESGINNPSILNNIRPSIAQYNLTIYNGRLVPAIFLKTLFERVSTYTGYSITGNFLDTTFYDKCLLLANNFYKTASTVKQTMRRITTGSLFFTSAVRTYGVAVTGARVDNQLPFNDDDFTIPLTTSVFQPSALMTYKITLDLKIRWRVPLGNGGLTALAFRFYECDSSGVYIGFPPYYTQEDLVIWNELKAGTVPVLTNVDIAYKGELYVQFEAGKYYRPYLIETIDTTGGTGTFQSTLTLNTSSITIEETEAIYPDETVEMNLCFTQKVEDVIKDVIKMNNLIIQTDNVTKEISFNRFDTLLENIGNATDLTHLVDLTKKQDISFTNAAFGQKNWFKYSNSDSERNDYLLVDNLNIKPESTIVTLTAKAVEEEFNYKDALGVNFYIPKVPIVQTDDYYLNSIRDAGTYFLIDDTQTISNHNFTIQNLTDSKSGTITDAGLIVANIPFAYFVKTGSVYSLDWGSLLDLNYTLIERIFKKFKFHKLYLRVNASYISSLDFSTPILINGNYYYINKIANYKGGSSIQHELILL